MSLGCQEAFEVFKRDHADSITIEDNKQLLKQRWVSHQNTAGGRHLKVHQQSGQELIILHQTSQASVEDSLQALHLFLLKTFHIQKALNGIEVCTEMKIAWGILVHISTAFIHLHSHVEATWQWHSWSRIIQGKWNPWDWINYCNFHCQKCFTGFSTELDSKLGDA